MRVNITESPDEVTFNMDDLFPSKLLSDADRSIIKLSKVTTRNPSEGKLSDHQLVDIKDMLDDIKEQQ